MRARRVTQAALALCAVASVAFWLATGAGDTGVGKKPEETERRVAAADLPAAARTALEKLAGGRTITAFAEEVEYGHTFYEASWSGASGKNVDALVTASGDLVEIEERVDEGDIPSAVLAAARAAAGRDTEVGFEKKTMVLYEAKFHKGDRLHEVLLTPDARRVEEETEEAGEEREEENE